MTFDAIERGSHSPPPSKYIYQLHMLHLSGVPRREAHMIVHDLKSLPEVHDEFDYWMEISEIWMPDDPTKPCVAVRRGFPHGKC